jgi:hypothetical protein
VRIRERERERAEVAREQGEIGESERVVCYRRKRKRR